MAIDATEVSQTHHLPFDGPFTGVETSHLVDTLEAQCERGEPLNPEVVWEIVERLAAANRQLAGHSR